jgi:hypothetical protein
MTDAKPKGVSLDAPKERLLNMRNEEFGRLLRQGKLPRCRPMPSPPAAPWSATTPR